MTDSKAPKQVGLALRAGLGFQNNRQPTGANHTTAKAASEKRPHLKNSFWTPCLAAQPLRRSAVRAR
jgi:hypothetical protein